MKTIEFNEDQINNLNEIGKALFNDEQDPRSVSYIRKLNRPTIKWFRICTYTLLPIILSIVLIIFFNNLKIPLYVSLIIVGLFMLGYIIINAKKAIICMIKIYQHYAPEPLRKKCRFEPSCSEYMILAIEKYGVINGARRGIRRLKRCNINNGGYDFP